MSDYLLPPTPVDPRNAVEVWVDMLNFGESLVQSGMAADFGPNELMPAYGRWSRQQLADHDRRLEHLLSQLSRRESRRGCELSKASQS